VNELGYPLIVTTTQDSTHSIFPTSFTISSTESEFAYAFILCALKKAYKKIYNKTPIFKYIMSDGADYIFNAIKNNLEGNQIHLMCYFHLKKAIKNKFAEKKIPKENRDKILICIDNLRSMISEKHFEKYYELFKSYYSSFPEFLEYFEKEWVSSNSPTTKSRFFDCEPNIFMTNNICESLNASIKIKKFI